MVEYCKFRNFCEDFIFAKLRESGVSRKKTNSRNGGNSLSFTDAGKSCPVANF